MTPFTLNDIETTILTELYARETREKRFDGSSYMAAWHFSFFKNRTVSFNTIGDIAGRLIENGMVIELPNLHERLSLTEQGRKLAQSINQNANYGTREPLPQKLTSGDTVRIHGTAFVGEIFKLLPENSMAALKFDADVPFPYRMPDNDKGVIEINRLTRITQREATMITKYRCPRCKGYGVVFSSADDMADDMMLRCPRCNGEGVDLRNMYQDIVGLLVAGLENLSIAIPMETPERLQYLISDLLERIELPAAPRLDAEQLQSTGGEMLFLLKGMAKTIRVLATKANVEILEDNMNAELERFERELYGEKKND